MGLTLQHGLHGSSHPLISAEDGTELRILREVEEPKLIPARTGTEQKKQHKNKQHKKTGTAGPLPRLFLTHCRSIYNYNRVITDV